MKKRFSHQAMATVFEVVVVHDDGEYAEQSAHEAFREVDRLEQVLSRYLENSDVSRINRAPVDRPVRVGPDVFECLERCGSLSSATRGAFDVTIGSLLEYWSEVDAGARAPSESRLSEIRDATGMKWIELDRRSYTVTRRSRGARVDLGGYGKGYAVDRMADILRDWSVDTAAVHGGASSLVALDAPSDERGWEVTLRDPANPDRILEHLSLQHRAVSASGLRRGRHIIDPRSGHPADWTRAAWALSETAALSDALSTAFMVMAPAEIANFCENQPDIQAIVLPAGDGPEGGAETVLRFGGAPPGADRWRRKGGEGRRAEKESSEMSKGKLTRRTAIRSLAAAGVGLTVVPRHVLGGRGYQAPSDTLNIAAIGVGGKGREDIREVGETENIYALCDVDLQRAAWAFEEYPEAKRFRDFRRMLELEADNIDAVTVTTPDHVHAAASVMAMRMGKPVFCQKPLARTLHEVRVMEKVAKKTGVPTQMGNQGHANDSIRDMREWVEAGAIGTVREVQYWTNRPIWPQGLDRPEEEEPVPETLDWDLWLGPAPYRPYNSAYAPFAWRGWWDFGTGALGDIACHAMDAAFWAFDLGFPSRIEAETTAVNEESAPLTSRIVYDFPARGGRGPIKVIWRDGGLTPAMPPGLGLGRRWPVDSIGGQLWVGDDGMLLAGVYGEQPRLLDRKQDREIKANPPPQKYPRSPGPYQEWIEAAKGGEPPRSSFDQHAGPLTQMVLLGNLAVRSRGPVEIDPENGKVLTKDIPEEYVRPSYRKGWKL